MPEAAVKSKRSREVLPSVPSSPVSSPVADAEIGSAAGTLTFVTSEGERIVFTDMDLPLGEVTPVAGEEALGKIWNRPAEDTAWRDM